MYHNRNLRQNALQEISSAFDWSIEEVKKKIHSLRTSFMNERKKLLKRKSGQAASNTNKPSQRYQALLFLEPVSCPTTKTESNLVSTKQIYFIHLIQT